MNEESRQNINNAAGKSVEKAPNPQPMLSAEFYAQLLELPPCKTGGKCNGCGKCQH